LKRPRDPRQETTLATKTLETEPTKARAEANFKKEERAKDGAKAMMEYLANSREVRERMAKLKALRLAQEQADTDKAATTKAATAKAVTTKATTTKAETKKAETKKTGTKSAGAKKAGKKAVNV
jgi:DNA topoisomerase-1